ncbi:MAG: hypothetical protein JKX69_08845 [Rhodobacteraceae bacterium]|nr:hypothetical protein [Paracoccaceae bacterium]
MARILFPALTLVFGGLILGVVLVFFGSPEQPVEAAQIAASVEAPEIAPEIAPEPQVAEVAPTPIVRAQTGPTIMAGAPEPEAPQVVQETAQRSASIVEAPLSFAPALDTAASFVSANQLAPLELVPAEPAPTAIPMIRRAGVLQIEPVLSDGCSMVGTVKRCRSRTN